MEPALEGAREMLGEANGETKGEMGRLWTGDWGSNENIECSEAEGVMAVMVVIRGTMGEIWRLGVYEVRSRKLFFDVWDDSGEPNE